MRRAVSSKAILLQGHDARPIDRSIANSRGLAAAENNDDYDYGRIDCDHLTRMGSRVHGRSGLTEMSVSFPSAGGDYRAGAKAQVVIVIEEAPRRTNMLPIHPRTLTPVAPVTI